MDSRHLRHFAAVIEHGAIGRAAAALNISQPALTKSIHRLEQDLGVKLFERQGRGIVPTVFGMALAEHARFVSIEIDHAAKTMTELKTAERGHVRLGASPSALDGLVPLATARLMGRQPGIRVNVVDGLGETLRAELLAGRIDLVVSGLNGMRPSPQLAQELLFTDSVVVVGGAHHPLSGRRGVTPEEAIAFPWIAPATIRGMRRRLESFFVEHGLGAPNIACEADATAFTRKMLQVSDHLTLLSVRLLAGEGPPLAVIDLDGLGWSHKIGLTYRRRGYLGPVASALIAELKLAASELEAEGGGRPAARP